MGFCGKLCWANILELMNGGLVLYRRIFYILRECTAFEEGIGIPRKEQQ